MWIGAGVNSTVLAASTVTLVTSLSAGVLLLRPFTILRSYMEILFSSDQIGTSEIPFGTFGRIIVTESAVGAGVTAIPDPQGAVAGDPDADWYMWQALSHRFTFVTGIGIVGDGGMYYQIDLKAMRKVGPDDSSAMVVTIASAVGAQIITNGRTLIQLH